MGLLWTDQLGTTLFILNMVGLFNFDLFIRSSTYEFLFIIELIFGSAKNCESQ